MTESSPGNTGLAELSNPFPLVPPHVDALSPVATAAETANQTTAASLPDRASFVDNSTTAPLPTVTLMAAESNPASPQRSSDVPATPTAALPALRLTVENVRPNRGRVKVAVFTDPDKFLLKGGATQTLELADTMATVSGDVDVRQPCAVAVFQDINGDGELTRNRSGIPIEPCGFSNNAVIKRGPPKFADAAVNLEGNTPTEVRIRLP